MEPNNLNDRLARLKHHLNPTPAPTSGKDPTHDRYAILAASVEGELHHHTAGCSCLVRRSVDFTHLIRDLTPNDAFAMADLPVSCFTADEHEGQVSLRDMLFLDTETTGLGGAGAVAFLIGIGRLTESGFEIRQYLLPDYADEAAMLEFALNEFSPQAHLVTYNGAAFDLPLLRDRVIINRVARELPHAGHFDLLHAARRLYRRRLRDCQLTNIERMIFDYHRVNDTPGYLIPSLYFDWLSYQKTDGLVGTLEHNRRDIIALAALAVHIAEIFQTRGEVLFDVDDLHSLSRVYGRRRQLDRVVELYGRIEPDPSQPALAPDITLYHANTFKRCGQYDRAVALWQQLAGLETREGYFANLELAKYFERHGADVTQAIACTNAALATCPFGLHHREQLNHRLARLQVKRSRQI